MGSRHPALGGQGRRALRRPVRSLGASLAGLGIVAGGLVISGATGIGVAPAADTVLSCTDTWTGGAGTTDWGTAGNWSTGVPDTTAVDVCIPGGATVIDQNATVTVGELTVAKGGSLTVGSAGATTTGSTGATLSVSSGLDNKGTLTAGPSAPGKATLALDGPVTNTGTFQLFGTLDVGTVAASGLNNAGTFGIAPGGTIDLENASTFTNAPDGLLAFGIGGPPTSASDYGRILNGSLSLDGSVASVFEGGFTPSSGATYVVATGSFDGTFAAVRNDATVDYSHPNALGLVGGAPATATAVSLTSTSATTVFGQDVRFTATVTPASGRSAPTGAVSFTAGGVPLGSTPVTTAGGVTTASIDTSDLPVGSEPVTATYGGDVLFGPSTSPVDALTVQPDSSTVAIAATPVNAVPGEPVTYTVSVSAAAPGAGRAGGTVSLSDDGNAVAGCQALTLSSTDPPHASCIQTYAVDATHSVVATYHGSADFLSSTATVTETVAPRPTTTSVTVSSPTSTIGEPVCFTATVAATAGTANPTGYVTFTDNGTPIGTSTLTTTDGVTNTGFLTTILPLGVNSIGASFGGDGDFGASASDAAPVTVSRAETTVNLDSSDHVTTSGQPVTFVADVFPATGSGETGTVTFSFEGTVIGRASVWYGQATLTAEALPAGTGPVTATYSGDGNFAGSSITSPWSQEVDPAPS